MTGEEYRQFAKRADQDPKVAQEFIQTAMNLLADQVRKEEQDPKAKGHEGELMFFGALATNEFAQHGLLNVDRMNAAHEASWRVQRGELKPEDAPEIEAMQMLHSILVAAFRLGFDQGRWFQAKIFTDQEE